MGAINSVLTTTLEKPYIRKQLIFAQLRSCVLSAFLMEKKRIVFEDGGHEITNPLIVGENKNITSYAYYDELPVNRTDEFRKVRYGFSRVAGTVIVSQQEEDENMGEAAVIKIVNAKLEVLKESIEEKFSDYFYGIGGGKDPQGLGMLIPDDPTTGTVGGIDRAANEFWRTMSYQFTSGTVTSTNISNTFRSILLDSKAKDEGKFDAIICGRNVYDMYSDFLESKSSLAAASFQPLTGVANYGFEALKYRNIPLMHDPNCDENHAYFINTKYLRLHVMRHVNMKVSKLDAPWVLDASGTRITWEGQLCLWKAAGTQAVLNIAASSSLIQK